VELPAFLTVTQAAALLQIGRTAAYDLAARYERSGGAEGLPVIRLGRALRVPRHRLELLAGGPLTASASPAPAGAETRPVDGDGVRLPFPPTAA
jgi:hypothetical protein